MILFWGRLIGQQPVEKRPLLGAHNGFYDIRLVRTDECVFKKVNKKHLNRI
ncbi:hypothetical protein X474_17110 [Dethiosulfatarculus sandiegensis]|uniref:Uncharacterized protein n=1 Tax=Dethiosulfatarculus sandiegensis TaxID=1429043 RepID=A0A0D2GCZ2_9BACT|nr:hypothetical protein X474_17110 [Dethiosulfatarculus sandiegensis]